MKKSTKNLINIALLILMFVALYFLEQSFGKRSMLITVLKKGAIYALIAVSMNLLNGFTGLFSLGQAGFMLVGAYTYAVLTIPMAKRMAVYQYYDGGIIPVTVPANVGILAAGLLAALLAALIGLPVLRLKSDYLAIATLGFAEIIRAIIQWDALGPVTNGSNLLKTYPTFTTVLQPFLAAVLCIGAIVLLINSTYGRAFKAIRDDEIAAEAMGINLFHHKQMAFVISSFFAGVGGALLGSHLSTIDPKMFNFLLTFNVLMFVVAGGLGSLTGSLLGATIVTILLEWLRAIEEPIDFVVLEIPGIPGMRMVVFSLILLAIILFRREGIMGTREITWKTIFSLGRRKA